MSYNSSHDRTYNADALQSIVELSTGFEGNNHFFTGKFPADTHPYACQKASCAVEEKTYSPSPSMAGKPYAMSSNAFEDHVLLVVNSCYPSGSAKDGFRKRTFKLTPALTKVNGNSYTTVAALKTAVLGLINS